MMMMMMNVSKHKTCYGMVCIIKKVLGVNVHTQIPGYTHITYSLLGLKVVLLNCDVIGQQPVVLNIKPTQ